MANYSDDKIQKIWEKGKIVSGFDENIFRKDVCGAWIKRDEYGNTDSTYGWEIDHKIPIAEGGTDEINNLRPFQWENNKSKGDDYPEYTSVVASGGDKNVYYKQIWEINKAYTF